MKFIELLNLSKSRIHGNLKFIEFLTGSRSSPSRSSIVKVIDRPPQRRSVTNPRGHCKLPIVPCAYELYYHFLVTSSFETTGAPGSIMAACLRTVKENQASFLKNSSLVYVHCVSKDDFPIGLAHFSCVKLICREKAKANIWRLKHILQ